MTAVLRLYINRYPFLIGDLLVSGLERYDQHVGLPTVEDMSEVFPEGSGFVPSDLAQKISIIRDNLVIGWSGTRVYARHVIKELYEKSKEKSLTRDFLNKYFQGIDRSIRESGTGFIGFIRDSIGMAHFSYNCIPRQTEQFGDVALLGTGSEDLFKLLAQFPVQQSKTLVGQPNAMAQASCYALSLTGTLLTNELATHRNLLEYYGGGYEIATWTSKGFKKATEVTQCFWSVDLHGREIRISKTPLQVFKYVYFDDVLAIRGADINQLDVSEKLVIKRHNFDIIPPMYRSVTKAEVEAFTLPSMDSPWICHYFLVKDHVSGDVFVLSRVDVRRKGEELIIFKEHKEGINILVNEEFLLTTVKEITAPFKPPQQ